MGEIGDAQPGRPAASPTLEQLEGRQIGRYLIRHRLGGGGVATVYQADDQVLGQTVALKLLPPNPDDATLNRFRREALMAGALRHPHIVRIFQVGTSARGGAAYLAMELVEGESLASLLACQGMLQPAESCNLLEPIARALAFAHQHGIVHRDVKPGNILLRPAGLGTRHSVQLTALDHPVIPLLSDFGVARFLDAPELTSTGRTVGTPAFMAPEQCMGSREIDGRADIYALGTVLFRCVTGRLPFTGSMTQVLHAQVYEPVVLQEDVLRRLGPVAAILQRSLAKDPDDRYADAARLAADLAAAAWRSGEGSPRLAESADATATLTLAVDALSPAEAARPVTVLVGGASDATATAGQIPMVHLPAAQAGARPQRHRRRGVEIVVALALVVLLGALGSRAWRWGRVLPRATPTAPQLAVLAAPPTPQGADSPTATSQEITNAAAAISPAVTSAGSVGTQTGAQPVATATVLPTFTPAQVPPTTLPDVAPPGASPPDAGPPAGVDTSTPSPEPTATAAPPPPVVAAPPVSETQGGAPQTDAVAGVCADVVDEFFMGALTGLDAALREAFRCPTAPAYATGGSLLAFAQGFMLALDESPFVYVYYQATGEWEQVVPSGDTAPEAGGPPPPFAQVWGEDQRRVALGEMLGAAPTPIDGVVQVFSGGMLVGDRTSGAVYAFPLNRLRL